MTPPELTEALIEKVVVAKEGDIPVSEQYRIHYQEQLQILEEGGSLKLEELRLSEYKDDSTSNDDDEENGVKISTASSSGDSSALSKRNSKKGI